MGISLLVGLKLCAQISLLRILFYVDVVRYLFCEDDMADSRDYILTPSDKREVR